MAKEFKDFDRLYRREGIKLAFDLLETMTRAEHKIAKEIVCWKYWEQLESWSNEQVRQAVYILHGHEDWQKFRVAMKQFDTQFKLFFLARYREQATLFDTACRRIRTDNYIGALRRGGQLDASYRIVK